MEARLLLGSAKADITPERPIPLAGFAHRQGTFESVKHPLHVRVFFFKQEEAGSTPIRLNSEQDESHKMTWSAQVLLLSADLIWWGSERLEGLRQQLGRRWGFKSEEIVFHATHNHSGPQTSGAFTSSIGKPDPAYISFLEAAILTAVEEAASTFEPVTVESGRGECHMGINRRKWMNGQIIMAPNASGTTDPAVTVTRFNKLIGGETKALLVHYSCHPTTTGDNDVSSEFPGIAMELLEHAIGGNAIATFVQGFCADVRPALVEGESFFRGDDKHVEQLGRMLADEVLAVLGRPMKQLPPAVLNGRRLTVPLPFQAVTTPKELKEIAEVALHSIERSVAESNSELVIDADSILPSADKSPSQHSDAAVANPQLLKLQPEIIIEWSRLLLSEPERLREAADLEMTLLTIAEGCSILAVNAEMSVHYGLWVKQLLGNGVMPTGYSNGMIGYVPTSSQIDEGGYEAHDSIYYFGLPGPFAHELESSIYEAIKQFRSHKE
ncbi:MULTISPECIES: neutral/alkaline non-lysosomal ceramidase N-terminal domain-containing protein [unclassified Paenibacillus]|uniref:neutral/alkaline non-lysosomal ceramidase N-terminal domain-containing protein n=1 Tax=unclassified Paenibacillus TaxID=185978 RepID=UPI00362DCCFA